MTTSPSPIVPGLTLGRVLGRGSTGVVYAARREHGARDGCAADRGAADHGVADIEYAVKVVTDDPPGAAYHRLRREVELSGSLRLPHLVRAHEVIRCPAGRTALVLDLVDGGSLAEVLRQRRHLLAGEVVGVLHPVLATLHELHERGVVHGDVSAGNVLIDRNGRPMLTDLGDARVAGEERARIRGTDGYVAPELLGGGTPTAASDVYATGALAWFLLVGSPAAIGFLRPPLAEAAPDAPPALVDVVEAMLRGEPEDRPTAVDAASALVAAQPPRPVDLPEGPDLAEQLTRRLREGGRPAVTPGHASKRAPGGDPEHEGRHRRSEPHRRLRRTGTLGRVIGGVAGVLTLALAGITGWWALDRWHLLPTVRPALSAATPAMSPESTPMTEPTPTAPTPTAPTTSSSRSTLSPVAVVSQLIEARAAAYRSADPTVLTGAYAPSSRALAREAASVGVLRSKGIRYEGLAYTVRVARSSSTSPQRVTATIDTSAYTIFGLGSAPKAVPKSAGTPVVLTLTSTDQGWRLTD